jgi:glycosyltransferase involved in cell wall biosynthesis
LHIWYIHHYAGGPGLGTHYRPYHLARAWRAQGHTTTIFMAGFHHLLEAQSMPSSDFSLDGARYVVVPARRYLGNGLGRILNMWDFSTGLRAAGRRLVRSEARPDAIVVSSPHPFSIFAAHALARKYRARLVFEVRDIWPLSLTEILGVSRWHPFVQLCAFAERFALRKAHLIASVLPRANRYLADRGYGNKPFLWVPNGMEVKKADGPAILGESSRSALEKLSQWKAQGCVTIVHAGSLGRPNAVDLLLEALLVGQSRGEAGNCRILLAGKGEQMSMLQQFVRDQKLDGVHFVGHVAKDEVSQLLRACDVAYAGVRSFDRLYRYGVSLNKFADYFAAALPTILPIAACGDPVSESGGGIARRMETPEAVWEGLSELIALSPEERLARGALGRDYMKREYDYEGIGQRYIAAIERLPNPV